MNVANRSFLAERENECLQGLLLCPVDRGTIYLAKTVGNFVFMMVAQLFIVPIFVFFFNLPMTVGIAGVFLSLALLSAFVAYADEGRLTIPIDSAWRFHLGDAKGAEKSNAKPM